MELVISDQGVRNVAERSLDRLSICDEGLCVLRFSEMQIPTKSAAGENRQADLCAIRPDSDLCRKRTGERRTSSERSSARARQSNLGKELCLGDTNFSVCCNQDLLRFTNVLASGTLMTKPALLALLISLPEPFAGSM
jgi:hypothetical protein